MKLLKQSMTWNKEELLEQQVFTMNWLAVSVIIEGGEMLCYRFVAAICNTYCTFICQTMHYASLFFKSYIILLVNIFFMNHYFVHILARANLIISNFIVKRKSSLVLQLISKSIDIKVIKFLDYFSAM